MSFKIKGRDGIYYDIFDSGYFAPKTIFFPYSFQVDTAWKDTTNNDITIEGRKFTDNTNPQYKATTNSTFKNSDNNDIFSTSQLITKYNIQYESTNDDGIDVDKRFNRLLIVAIGGGGGGERGTSGSGGSPGRTGQIVANSIDISEYNKIKIQIEIGNGGAGGNGKSGANGYSGDQTNVTIKSGSYVVGSVQASGGGGGGILGINDFTYTQPGPTDFKDVNYTVDKNSNDNGAGGAGGGKYNGGLFYESGYDGKYGKKGVVYIYYFHK